MFSRPAATHRPLTSYQSKHPKTTTKPPDPYLPFLSTEINLKTGFSWSLLMIKVNDLLLNEPPCEFI